MSPGRLRKRPLEATSLLAATLRNYEKNETIYPKYLMQIKGNTQIMKNT